MSRTNSRRATGWRSAARPERGRGRVDVHDALAALFDAATSRHSTRLPAAVAVLEQTETEADQATVNAALAEQLVSVTRDVWERGWQPLDVVRVAAKHCDAATARLSQLVVLAEALTTPGDVEVPHQWRMQVEEIRTEAGRHTLDGWLRGSGAPARPGRRAALSTAARLIRLLSALPTMPQLLPPPTEWTARSSAGDRPVDPHGLDDRMLDKIRALLAKAESTTFEEEATALTGKAQELMARYAIDEALVLTRHGAGVGAAVARRIRIDDPYAKAKFTLLAQVGDANRCVAVWSKEFGFADVFGSETDLEIVDVLYTSLLVQATAAMLAAGEAPHDPERRSRSFRQSFLISFAVGVGQRLRDTTATTADQATAETGVSVLPVLASRAAAAEEAAARAHPQVRSIRASSSNYDGFLAGRSAAERADLGAASRVGGGSGAGALGSG